MKNRKPGPRLFCRRLNWKQKAASGLLFIGAALLIGCGAYAGEKTVGAQASLVSMEAAAPKQANLAADDYEGWNKLLADCKISDSFRDGLSQFAFESGSKLLQQAAGNRTYSPLSLSCALALVGSGASGETEEQILSSLGTLDQEELALQCQRLLQWYSYQDQRQSAQSQESAGGNAAGKSSVISLANSLWISDQIAVEESYQKLAAEQFFASSYLLDFTSPDAGTVMGQWISKQTQGVIEPKITPNPATKLSLINTLYFYGSWRVPFDEKQTETASFTLADGRVLSVPFLSRKDFSGKARRGDGYTVSYLDTENQCRMVFLLPDKGLQAAHFLTDPQILRQAMEGSEEEWEPAIVNWKIPKFSFASSLTLNQQLKELGMTRMFQENADFSRISHEGLMVSDIIQETHLGIDEQGVEGAAYTMVMMEASGAPLQTEPVDMTLDRPFLFGIQDAQNGVWLFLGICQNPQEETASSGTPAAAETDAAPETAAVPGTDAEAGKPASLEKGSDAPPRLTLIDPDSSDANVISADAGTYQWNWIEDGKSQGAVACGASPLDFHPDTVFQIPDDNGQTGVDYRLSCPILPDQVTVCQWDRSKEGELDAAADYQTSGTGLDPIHLENGKRYEITAQWDESNQETNGFWGTATYLLVTGKE